MKDAAGCTNCYFSCQCFGFNMFSYVPEKNLQLKWSRCFGGAPCWKCRVSLASTTSRSSLQDTLRSFFSFKGARSAVFEVKRADSPNTPLIGLKLALASEVSHVCQCQWGYSLSSYDVSMTLGDVPTLLPCSLDVELFVDNLTQRSSGIEFLVWNLHTNQWIKTRSSFDMKKLTYLLWAYASLIYTSRDETSLPGTR